MTKFQLSAGLFVIATTSSLVALLMGERTVAVLIIVAFIGTIPPSRGGASRIMRSLSKMVEHDEEH
jgi:hypothetical protein